MTKQYNAIVTERGNGLPDTGGLVYDPHTDTVWEIVWSSGRLETGRSGHRMHVRVVESDWHVSEYPEEAFSDVSMKIGENR